MAKAEIQFGELGGGEVSIIPDTTQQLGSITTNTGTYTATENCIMQGTMNNNTSGDKTGWIALEKSGESDITLITAALSSNNFSCSFDSIFIPKGYTVKVRNVAINYNVKFYKIASS